MHVLLVEDDEGDAFLVRELLLDAGSDIELTRARHPRRGRALLPDGRRLRPARPRAARTRRAWTRLRRRARDSPQHRGPGPHRPRRRAPRDRGGRRRRPGLPGQGQHRRPAAHPRHPLRRRAQAGRRVGPPALRVRGAGGRERPPRARPAAPAAGLAATGVAGRRALPSRPAPVGARRRLLRRRRVRRRLGLRADRRRRRATARTRPRSASACASPGAPWCSPVPTRTPSSARWTPCSSASASTDEVFATVAMVRLDPGRRCARVSGGPATRCRCSSRTPGSCPCPQESIGRRPRRRRRRCVWEPVDRQVGRDTAVAAVHRRARSRASTAGLAGRRLGETALYELLAELLRAARIRRGPARRRSSPRYAQRNGGELTDDVAAVLLSWAGWE